MQEKNSYCYEWTYGERPQAEEWSGLLCCVGWTVAPSQGLEVAWNERSGKDKMDVKRKKKKRHEKSLRFCIN